jgi:hypothetical protein
MNEIALAILAITWGIILMLPGDLFEGCARRPLHCLAGHDRSFTGVYRVPACTAHRIAPARHRLLSCNQVSKIAARGGATVSNSYRFTEALLGALGITWGIWLVAFHSYQLSPVLAALRDWHVPEYIMVWWPVLAGSGLLFLRPRHRRPLHLVMCAFWAFIAFAIAQTNLALTAIPVYAVVGILHGGSYVLAERNER